MAFVVQCPFCKLKAKVPDRANGAIGRCPKCASSFTLAPADDQHLPESAAPGGAEEPDIEPIAASAVGAAIAEAAAAVEEAKPADALSADAPHPSPPSGFQPAAAAGAFALFLSGIALICSSISWLRGVVTPLCVLALLTGLAAIVATKLSARPRLLLPGAGVAAATVMLLVAWLFPALLGPAYQTQTRRDQAPAGLHAIPLAGAPALTELPEWVDAKRYALQRDGLRVQVMRASLIHQAATDTKPAHDLLLVRVRISLERDAKPLERKDQPNPTLTDDAGVPLALRQSEFSDRGDGKSKGGLFPFPTIEETFAFDPPAEECKTLRLVLPAARWRGTGTFQFTMPVPGDAAPRPK